MFFPDELKKITQPQESEGFVCFNPKEGIESFLDEEEEAEAEEFKESLRSQHKLFLIINFAITIVNLLILFYCAGKLDIIYNFQESEKEGMIGYVHGKTVTMIVLILMIMQFAWLLNFLLGYNFFRYELNYGIIFYFVILHIVLFTRIILNFFVIVAKRKLINIIGEASFNLPIYLIFVILECVGDILLIGVAARIKFTYRKLNEILDKKLIGETISDIVLLE